MLIAHNILVSFGGRTALEIHEKEFLPGKIHGIIGLNGAGKSTFFNSLTQIINPEKAEITFNGSKLQPKEIAYLEAANFFYPLLTGREYLQVFPQTNANFNLQTFQGLLQLPLDNLIETYSTGMKKKLALLAMLQQDKPIFILDEPFNGLDLESNRTLEMIVQLLRKKGKTIFISAHILEPLLHTCNQIHLLEKGNFVQTFEEDQFPEIKERLFRHLNQDLQSQISGAL